jgi:hypothetical protein
LTGLTENRASAYSDRERGSPTPRYSTPSGRRSGLNRLSESALAFLLLAGIAAAAFTAYILDGGFHSDDWAYAAWVRQGGYLHSVGLELDVIPNRPLLAFLQILPHSVFGGDPRPELALAVVLAILVSICFYHLLRMVHMPALGAATVAGLVLLFPWSDSTRLWPVTSINQVAVILYLLGAITAIWGLRTSGRRAVLIHLCATTLFVASVLTYEATGAIALATGLLYFAFTTRRTALFAWGVDIVAVGAAIAYSAATTTKTIATGHSQFVYLGKMVRGAAVLTAHAAFPAVGGHTWVVVGVLVVVAAAASVAFFGKDRLLSKQLRSSLVTLAVATAGIGLSYVMFVPAAYWTPQARGLENRVNVVAALPISLFVYTFVTLLILLVIPPARGRSRLRAGLVSLIAIALAVDYGVRLHNDERIWTRAYTAERNVSTLLREALPNPRPGTTIFTFDVPAQVAPRMPVFYDTWDLYSVAQIIYRDASISAYPVFVGAQFICGATGVTPLLPTPSSSGLDPRVNGQRLPLPYGSVVFVDIIGGRVQRISSPRDCRQAVSRFAPGPVQSAGLLRLISDRARRVA